MKRHGHLVCLLSLAAVLGTTILNFAQERQRGGGITVYADVNFSGINATFREDVPNLVQLGFNDTISSITVGRGEQWEVCEHENYQGRCIVVSGDEPDLRRNSLNDLISSFRRVRGGYPRPPSTGDNSIVLFDRTNYQGNPRNYNGPVADLSDFNGRVRSVTVGRGVWELCEGRNFTGRCVTVSTSVPDLNTYNFRNRVSSMRPLGYGGPTPPSTSDWYIVLYDRTTYQGSPTNYRAEELNVNKRARSLTIGKGVWEICDGTNFTGRCITLSQSVPDLSLYGFRNRIGSLRPAASDGSNPVSRDWYIVLYDQPNYGGTPANYRDEQLNIKQRARSVTIGRGRWEICDGKNFTGRCITLNDSVPELRSYDIGDRILSLRPVYRQPR